MPATASAICMLRERSMSTASVAERRLVVDSTSAGRSMAIVANTITARRKPSRIARRRGDSRWRGKPSKVSNSTSTVAAAATKV